MLSLLPLHPRMVHFPIALLITGSVAALLYVVRWRRPALAILAWSTLLLGWVALFGAILTGLIDQNNAPQTEMVRAVLNPHIALGFGLLIVYGLALYERLRFPGALDTAGVRWRVALLLLLGISLVVIEGALGGRLVYGLDVGVMSNTP